MSVVTNPSRTGVPAATPTGIVELYGDGAPAASAQAELTVNPAGDDNSLTYTAVEYGPDGDGISIEYVDPEADDSPLAVEVTGKAIVVSLETDGDGDIISTAAEVLAEVLATPAAAALVDVDIDAADTGVADDGSGVVTAMAAAPLAGGTGTGVGAAARGSRYTRLSNGKLYLNGGTALQPDWKLVTSA